MIVNGSVETGNSIYGSHYGRYESRYSLGYDFSKKAAGVNFHSLLQADFSTLEGLFFSQANAGFSDLSLGQFSISGDIGDIRTRLGYYASSLPGMVRGLGWEIKWRALSWQAWAGTPYEIYRNNSSLAARSTGGTMFSIRAAPWLKQGLFVAGHSYTEDRDSLNRSSLILGWLTELYPVRRYDLSLTAALRQRSEARSDGHRHYRAPYFNLSSRWTDPLLGLTFGLEYYGRHYQIWNPRASVWLRLGAWYRPTDLTRFSGNYSNQNASGDTTYPWITNTWDLGTNLNLPKLPQVNIKYYSSDQKLDWGGPDPKRYVTIERTYEAVQSVWRVDGRISYRLTDRDERVRNLSAFRMETFRIRPVLSWGQYQAWPSCEFENWRDLKSNNNGRTLRLRAGASAGWRRWGSKITAEGGINSERVMWGPRQMRWVADIQLRANITRTYLLSLSWWNESSVAQDTGFFYRPDYNRFKLTLSKTFDLSGHQVEGVVFLDKNQNGRQDRGESGLSGIKVMTANGQQAITDARGRYVIPNINQSRTTIRLDLTTVSAEYNIVGQYEQSLALGGWRSPRADFPLTALGGVRGRVFFDRNKNGSFDQDDYGISGVTVILKPSGLTAITNGGGTFRFANVPTGEQYLMIDTISAPSEYEPLSSQPQRINVIQGEIVNHLELAMTRKFRPVKRTVFEGEITLPLISVPEARAAELPKPATRTKPSPGLPAPARPAPPGAPRLSQEEIDQLYREGTRLFSAGEYQQALKIWQRILNADPSHANARRNLERTRQKLEALKRTKG